MSRFRSRPVRRATPLSLACALALAAVACGGEGPSGGDCGGEGGGCGDPSARGTAVEHMYGTTEVPDDPERVVTIGLSDHETALALGVVPVGVEDWFGEEPFGQWPWAAELWQGEEPEVVGERDDVNVEAVARLEPDVIVAAYSGITEEQYDTLTEIAPVVAQPADHPPYTAPWQDLTLQVGRALAMPDEAQALVDEVEAEFAAVREAHPDWQGMTATVADPFEPGQWAVFTSGDPKAVFMEGLGFTTPPEIDETAGEDTAAVVSSERIDLLEADRLVFLSSSDVQERVEGDELFQRLTVAQEGGVVFLPYEEPPIGAALSFNTVLSIPWAIEQVVPLLEGASTTPA